MGATAIKFLFVFALVCALSLGHFPLSRAQASPFTITLTKTQMEPLAGVKCYVFSGGGSYLGLSGTSDAAGVVSFNLADGVYKLRADYLGYQFWSDLFDVPASLSGALVIPHQDVVFRVEGVNQGLPEPMQGLKVYLFTAAGAYQGKSQMSDANGEVTFSVPERSYKVRADYLGQQFWSEASVWQDKGISIPLGGSEVTVTGAGVALGGVKVYVFSTAGSYLGETGTTDAAGKVIFTLPEGSYKYRVDYHGRQYWSGVEPLIAGQTNPVSVSTGGGTFTLTVRKDETESLSGLSCYVFSDRGSYLGISGTSDAAGVVSFNLADGVYKFRVDYLGYQFWSDLFNVPAFLSGALVIPHQDVVVRVEGLNQGLPEPMQGLKVYLFTASGAYQAQSQVTDSEGHVIFDLPEQSYKARVDYLGQQFWSDPFIWQNTTVAIPIGDASVTVTGMGFPMAGVKVYVFSAAGSYLGISETTDATGQAVFTLPTGSYQYRADYLGNQYWSGIRSLASGPVVPVNIATGGGRFTLTVKKNEIEPLSGLGCYVFNDRGSYLGLNGASDADGTVSFDLSDGVYKFRADYLGYQFWSEIYSVPARLSGTLDIPHQDVVVRVEGVNQSAPEPLRDVTVYLFAASGAYQRQSRVTNVNGEATFNLPEQSYKVRADYLGQQFWSEVLPWQNTTIAIPLGDKEITVHSDLPLAGARVYVFSADGSYLGLSGTTDTNGKVSFTLAAGSYKFRADYQGNQYWTGEEDLVAGQINPTRVCTSEIRLVPGDGQAGDRFGASVSVSGDFAIIGAPGDDDEAEDGGSAYVFSRASPWAQYGKLVASDSGAGDHFGNSVSMDGAFALAGAHGDDDTGLESGSAYIFHHDGNAWTEQSKITAGDGRAGDSFGCSVSISGTAAIVGAEGYDGGHGGGWDGSHIQEFEGGEMQWWWGDHWESYYGGFTLVPKGAWAIGYRPTKVRLTYNRGVSLEHFSVRDATGTVVFGETSGYLSGQELEIACTSDIGQIRITPASDYPWILGIEFYDPGEPGGEDSGAAYIFRYDGSSWSEQAKLIPSASETGDHFGASVGVEGDYAIVGAYGKDQGGEDSGCAYIFKFDGSTWVEQGRLQATDSQAGACFGASVSLSGDYAIVGADSDDNSGVDAGAAYVFRRHGSVWAQQAKLTAGDAQAGDHFGTSVSINGSYAVIGAFASDGKGTDSGSIYVFKRNGTNWKELGKYVPNAGKAGDHFGTSVSMGQGYIAAGSMNSDDKGSDSGSTSIYSIASYHDAALKLSPEAIPLGGSATLSWNSINADSVAIDQGIGVVPLNGAISVSPAVTTIYTMIATGPHGTDTNDVTITVDQPPSLTLTEPNGVDDRVHNRFTIQWTDADAEQNAAISLYYDSDGSGADGVLIVSGLREDPDGLKSDTYVWDTSNIPEGSYHVYAVIDDGFNPPAVRYSSGVIAIDHDLYPEAKPHLSPAGYDACLGAAVSLSGNYAIVGAPGDSYEGMSNSGSAYILHREGGTWVEHSKLVASDADDWHQFGRSVSINGEYAIVGAYGDDVGGSSSGSAYIFKLEGSTWAQQAKLVPSDAYPGALFGWSVSISGDFAAIGAPGARSGGYYHAGAAYIFKRNGSAWVQEAKLVAGDASCYDQFGVAVCINGGDVIIGADGDSEVEQSGGAAYVFRREGSTWFEQDKLVGSGVGAYDAFGRAVSMDGDYAIVGAPHPGWESEVGPEPGSAYIFKREGGTWIEQAQLVPINAAEDGLSGNCVSISGGYALVGAQWANEGLYGHRMGSAYVFNREGSVWKEFVEMTPSPGSYYELGDVWFGSAVAVNGADIIVGASADFPSGSAYTYSLIPLSMTVSSERILIGGSAILSWECPEATSVSIDNGIGYVPSQGSISVSPAVTTTYTITASTPVGSRTLSVKIIVDTVAISITSPLNGGTIERPDISVEGTIMNPLGLEVGINLNGVVALLESGRFVANNVPLEQGENTIVATATTLEGHTASAQITVYADTAGEYVKLKADPESGISPFETTLRIEASFSFTTPSLDYTGPGTVQILSHPTPNDYTVAMTAPGLYEFTVQVTDGQSNVHTDSVTILVMDQLTLDGILKTKWNAMKSALIAGNNQKALTYFHSGTKSDYDQIFSALGTTLPAIASAMGEIGPVYYRDKMAKYRIRRAEVVKGQTYNITYYIYFVKDSNGLWQIESF